MSRKDTRRYFRSEAQAGEGRRHQKLPQQVSLSKCYLGVYAGGGHAGTMQRGRILCAAQGYLLRRCWVFRVRGREKTSSVTQSVAERVLDRGEGDELNRSGGTSFAKAESFDRTTRPLRMTMALTDQKLLKISILQHMAFEQGMIDTVKDDSRGSR
jgi:hypothetical protein